MRELGRGPRRRARPLGGRRGRRRDVPARGGARRGGSCRRRCSCSRASARRAATPADVARGVRGRAGERARLRVALGDLCVRDGAATGAAAGAEAERLAREVWGVSARRRPERARGPRATPRRPRSSLAVTIAVLLIRSGLDGGGIDGDDDGTRPGDAAVDGGDPAARHDDEHATRPRRLCRRGSTPCRRGDTFGSISREDRRADRAARAAEPGRQLERAPGRAEAPREVAFAPHAPAARRRRRRARVRADAAHAAAPSPTRARSTSSTQRTARCSPRTTRTRRLPIASITKLMTVIVALDHLKPSDVVTVSGDAAQVGESRIPLVRGPADHACATCSRAR